MEVKRQQDQLDLLSVMQTKRFTGILQARISPIATTLRGYTTNTATKQKPYVVHNRHDAHAKD